MAFYHPFKVRFYEYYSPIENICMYFLRKSSITASDCYAGQYRNIMAPLQFLVVYAVNQ